MAAWTLTCCTPDPLALQPVSPASHISCTLGFPAPRFPSTTDPQHHRCPAPWILCTPDPQHPRSPTPRAALHPGSPARQVPTIPGSLAPRIPYTPHPLHPRFPGSPALTGHDQQQREHHAQGEQPPEQPRHLHAASPAAPRSRTELLRSAAGLGAGSDSARPGAAPRAPPPAPGAGTGQAEGDPRVAPPRESPRWGAGGG